MKIWSTTKQNPFIGSLFFLPSFLHYTREKKIVSIPPNMVEFFQCRCRASHLSPPLRENFREEGVTLCVEFQQNPDTQGATFSSRMNRNRPFVKAKDSINSLCPIRTLKRGCSRNSQDEHDGTQWDLISKNNQPPFHFELLELDSHQGLLVGDIFIPFNPNLIPNLEKMKISIPRI